MKWCPRLAVGLMLAALSPFACASAKLTLREVLAAVQSHNPEIASAEQQRAIAASEVRVASAFPNPEASWSAGPWRSRAGTGTSGVSTQFGVSQLVELPSIRNTRVRAVQSGVTATEFQSQSIRIDVGHEARTAFNELLKRQEEARIAAENLAVLTAIQARVRSRVQVGEAARLELVRADAETLTARTAADAARLQVEEARGLVRRLAGNALPAQFEAAAESPAPPAQADLAMMQQTVLANHPRLKALAAEHDRALARLEHERALRTPQPTVGVFHAQDPETRQTVAGVSLPLPLWNRREGQIAQARAHVDYALIQIEAQRSQLLRELDAAYARASILQRQVETYEGGLLASAESAVKVAEAAWRFGERGFLEVLDAQRILRAVRRDYNQALFDRNAAWIALERLQARDPFSEGSAK